VQVFVLVPNLNIPAQYNPVDISNLFSFDVFKMNFLYAGLGILGAGIATMLLRQNTYALYALVIFAIGVVFPVVSKFVYAIPNMIDMILFMYPAFNPFANVGSGVFAGSNPFSLLFVGFGTFAAFWFLLDKVTGGQTS
jgi:hypothetical protein